MKFKFDAAGMDGLLTDHNGPIAQALENFANETVLPDAQGALSAVELPPGRWPGMPENRPPGPPRYRTGDLYNSLAVIPAVVAQNMSNDNEVVVYVSAAATHGGFDYVSWLRGMNGIHRDGIPYRFLPDSPIYTYTEI